MGRFLLRRLALLPVVVLALNVVGFMYASVAMRAHQALSPYGHRSDTTLTVVEEYLAYAQGLLRLDFGNMPVGVNVGVGDFVGQGLIASLGLLGLALLLSLVLGLPLGRAAVQVDPPKSRGWLTVLSTIGLAMPGFYVGTVLITWIISRQLQSETPPPIPVGGYGWDLHLVLPLIALTIRPTVQIAQVMGGLLADELGKRYITTARGFGATWRMILREKALKNILAPLFLAASNSFRLTVAELILVEWLFSWPGIGRMLARALVPPSTVGPGGLLDLTVYFLHPPLMALLLPIFGILFYLVDTLATALARGIDPRIGAAAHEEVVFG